MTSIHNLLRDPLHCHVRRVLGFVFLLPQSSLSNGGYAGFPPGSLSEKTLNSSLFADQPDDVISPSQLHPKHYAFLHKKKKKKHASPFSPQYWHPSQSYSHGSIIFPRGGNACTTSLTASEEGKNKKENSAQASPFLHTLQPTTRDTSLVLCLKHSPCFAKKKNAFLGSLSWTLHVFKILS